MPELIKTLDGSTSVYVEDLKESYHSKNGALTESLHVFIKNGFDMLECKQAKILEIGLGTGLNAVLTANKALEKQLFCQYVGLEPFPLGWDFLKDCSFSQMPFFEVLHNSPSGEKIRVNPFFEFIFLKEKIEDAKFEKAFFDLIYFDAFASQKELWATGMLLKCHKFLRDGGLLVTYAANGQLKRDLRSIGFEVESPQGAPGKKEMTRAKKVSN